MAGTVERLWGVIEPYLAAEGIELDDIEVLGGGGAQIVRVVVDAPDGLDVDRIADVSRGIARLLDEEDPISGPYTLEVTSPGLERKLRRPRHYEKSIGREVKVKTTEPVEGSRTHRGTLVAADEQGMVLDMDGTERSFGYDEVSSARTVFVWDRPKKPRKQKA